MTLQRRKAFACRRNFIFTSVQDKYSMRNKTDKPCVVNVTSSKFYRTNIFYVTSLF